MAAPDVGGAKEPIRMRKTLIAASLYAIKIESEQMR